jgi:hypothetical protein
MSHRLPCLNSDFFAAFTLIYFLGDRCSLFQSCGLLLSILVPLIYLLYQRPRLSSFLAAVAVQDIVQLVNYPSVVLILFIWLKHAFHPFGSFVDLTLIDCETFDSSFIYRDHGLTFSTASSSGRSRARSTSGLCVGVGRSVRAVSARVVILTAFAITFILRWRRLLIFYYTKLVRVMLLDDSVYRSLPLSSSFIS